MPPISPKQIPALYQKALNLQNAGKLNEALAAYQTIFNTNPRIAEVHFQVARIFASAGKYAKALPHLKEACAIKPSEAAIWQVWAETLQSLGDQKQISSFLKEVANAPLNLAQKARLSNVFNTPKPTTGDRLAGVSKQDIAKLISLMNARDYQQAEKKAKAQLKVHPKSSTVMHILATAQARLGKSEEALTSFRKALALAPRSGQIHNDLGRLLLDLGRPVEAAEELRRALNASPKLAIAMSNLARTLGRLDQDDEALELAQKACKTDPQLSEAHFTRATLLAKAERDSDAVDAYQKAIELGDKSPQTYALMARAQGVLRRDDEAMENFAKAIEIAPDYAFAYTRRATLLQAQGNFDAAKADFRKALELDPNNGETYRVFSASHKFTADDPLIAQMKERYADQNLDDTNRMNLGFALSKAMDDCKEYDQVFPYLNTANALMRKAYPYDVNSRAIEIEKIKDAFSGVNFSAYEGVGDDSFAPVFVTGMPRSGTTLVEQILASHSTVSGAGEIGEFSREAYRLIGTPQGAFNLVSNISNDALTGLGQHYTRFMRDLFPDADRITDKSIQTYSFMGFVKLALPRARVVVVRRDPRDNLLSIYKNVFREGTHRYAYNLRDLGVYYKLFEEMIGFWRDTLPGYFHEIHYDALTANPEEESRKLLAACDLEWEDQCLNFHQTKRRVETLSVYQVRQPIYRSSVKAWQRYEDDLGELFGVIGPNV